MLIAEMPEPGRMTSAEAAAMTGLAPVPRDSGTLKGRRAIAGGRQSLGRVLFQAALAAAHHNPSLKPVVRRLKKGQAPQTRHRRYRTQARHNRKRNPEINQTVADKIGSINSVASGNARQLLPMIPTIGGRSLVRCSILVARQMNVEVVRTSRFWAAGSVEIHCCNYP